MRRLNSEEWNLIADCIKHKLEGNMHLKQRIRLSNALGAFIKIKPGKFSTPRSLYVAYKKRAIIVNAKPLPEVEFYRTIAILEELNIL